MSRINVLGQQITVDGWIPAIGSWTYSSADNPTGVITVPSGAASLYGPGDRIKLTQTTVKYFIVTAVTDTTLTVYGGTDYTLANAAISAIYYSHQKTPLGFPADPSKWTVELSDITDRSQASAAAGTWYNLGTLSITIPIGLWRVEYFIVGRCDFNGTNGISITLSTTNNGASDSDFISHFGAGFSGGTGIIWIAPCTKAKILSLASKTVYYCNMMEDSFVGTIYFRNSAEKMFVRAICAYL